MVTNVEIKGLEEIQNTLNKLRLSQQDTNDLLDEAVLRPIYNATSKAFEDETSPFGKMWEGLSAKTIEKKGHSKALYETGKLSDSLYKDTIDGVGHVGVNASKDDYQYGRVHQFGDKKGLIPIRPFLPIDKNNNMPYSLEEKIARNIEEWFDDLVD